MLLQDPTIEALVISASDDDVIHKGWPVDHCDIVLIHDAAPDLTGSDVQELGDLMRWAAPLAPRHLIVDSKHSQVIEAARQHFGGAAHVEEAAAPCGNTLKLATMAADLLSQSTEAA
jgi:hypothetical protein